MNIKMHEPGQIIGHMDIGNGDIQVLTIHVGAGVYEVRVRDSVFAEDPVPHWQARTTRNERTMYVGRDKNEAERIHMAIADALEFADEINMADIDG